jgi:hypothetical protein
MVSSRLFAARSSRAAQALDDFVARAFVAAAIPYIVPMAATWNNRHLSGNASYQQ